MKHYLLKLIFVTLPFLHVVTLFAQSGIVYYNGEVNRIVKEIKKNQQDPLVPSKIDTLLRLAEESNVDTIQAKAYLSAGNAYQTRANLKMAWHYHQLSKIYYLKVGLIDKAAGVAGGQFNTLTLQTLSDSLLRFMDANSTLFSLVTDPVIKMKVKGMYAYTYDKNNRKKEAMQQYYELITITDELKDTIQYMATCAMIAMGSTSFDSSLFWYKRALAYVGRKEKSTEVASRFAELLVRTGYVFYERSGISQDSALYYFLEAEKHQAVLTPQNRVVLYHTLGEFFLHKNQKELAFPYLKKACAAAGTMPGSGSMMSRFINAHILLGQKDSAAYYLGLYKQQVDKVPNDRNYMFYYQTVTSYEMSKGDSCSPAVMASLNEALSYAMRLKNVKTGQKIILDIMKCLNKHPGSDVASTLGKAVFYYENIKQYEDPVALAAFLEQYAPLLYKYGKKDRAVEVYSELNSIQNKITNDQYMKGVDEAVVKYESKVKDVEIALLKEKDKAAAAQARMTIGGLIALVLISMLVFLLYRKENKNRRTLDVRNKKVEQLLREVHHRVKNNLQVVTSFINIQLDKFSEQDTKAREALQDTSTRIMALAGLHQSLYNHDDLSKIKLDEYIHDLCIVIGRNINTDVKINCDVEDLQLDIDQAIPIGLAVNELITNALKHAFSKQEKGEINVQLKHRDKWQLIVKDNGIGLPENLDLNELHSIGIRLVQDITETQLKGEFSFYNEGGAVFKIEFVPLAA